MMKNTISHIKSAITATKTQKTLLKNKSFIPKAQITTKMLKNTILYINSAMTATKTPKKLFLDIELYSENADYDEHD